MCQGNRQGGFILSKGADGAAFEGAMSEPVPEGIIPIPFAGDGMECVGISGYITFSDIEVNAGPRAKLLDCV